MRNPLPKHYHRPVRNLLIFLLVYLALTELHAMIDGRMPAPPWFLIVGFAIGSLIAVYIGGAKEKDRV